MPPIYALLLGAIEGLTEFLPVSSTGHLILVQTWLGIPSTEFVKSFEIIIQLGAIFAVMLLYGKQLITHMRLLRAIMFAFIPTACIGFLLYKTVKVLLLGNPFVVVVSLFIGGIILILLEKRNMHEANTTELDAVEPMQAIWIGVAQSFSLIPGVSRSAATIIGGRFIGLSKKAAVEFSFILAIPTMIAATALDIVKSNIPSLLPHEFLALGIGLLMSFVTALVVVKYFLTFIQKYSFIPFGIYRIILAVISAFFLLS